VIEMSGTGKETRDFIFIEDILQAINLVLEHASFEAEVINVANGYEVEIQEAINVFFKLYKPKQSYYFNSLVRKGDPLQWRADIRKISGFGYQQKFDLEKGLALYTNWLKNGLHYA
jgi:dTDP-glucose 4,6-dehydratase/UDP-glucose 4-epimerase